MWRLFGATTLVAGGAAAGFYLLWQVERAKYEELAERHGALEAAHRTTLATVRSMEASLAKERERHYALQSEVRALEEQGSARLAEIEALRRAELVSALRAPFQRAVAAGVRLDSGLCELYRAGGGSGRACPGADDAPARTGPADPAGAEATGDHAGLVDQAR